jgi:hypothetical protein
MKLSFDLNVANILKGSLPDIATCIVATDRVLRESGHLCAVWERQREKRFRRFRIAHGSAQTHRTAHCLLLM